MRLNAGKGKEMLDSGSFYIVTINDHPDFLSFSHY